MNNILTIRRRFRKCARRPRCGGGDDEVDEDDDEEDQRSEGAEESNVQEDTSKQWHDMSCIKGAIFRSGTRVTFFAAVTTFTIARLLALVQQACDLILHGRQQHMGLHGFIDGCVEVHIASNGGNAFAGLTAYDMMQRMPVPTRGVVCGSCCSAATMILLGCTERCGLPHSFLLLHEVRTETQGSVAELRVDLNNTAMLVDAYRDIYRQCSSLSLDQVIVEMAHEGMLSAARACSLGLLHRILGPTKVLPRGQRMAFVPPASVR